MVHEHLKKELMKHDNETPEHYTGTIQPIEFIMSNDIPFAEGNVIKYVFRHKKKNGLEDLKKAKHYLQILIDSYND